MCDTSAGCIDLVLKVLIFEPFQSFAPSFLANLKLTIWTRTLFVSASGLENAKKVVTSYKQGETKSMTPEIWQAKKIIDSTLHPGTADLGSR